MTLAEIIQQALAEGISLAISPTGQITATGNREAVDRWLPAFRKHKAELFAALSGAGDRKHRALERQRARRKRLRRIDYYPSPEAAAIIDAHLSRFAGGDCSSVINRLIKAAALIPEFRNPKKSGREPLPPL